MTNIAFRILLKKNDNIIIRNAKQDTAGIIIKSFTAENKTL